MKFYDAHEACIRSDHKFNFFFIQAELRASMKPLRQSHETCKCILVTWSQILRNFKQIQGWKVVNVQVAIDCSWNE